MNGYEDRAGRWIGCVALLAVMLACPVRAAGEPWQPVSKHLYLLEIGDAVAGWMTTSVERHEKRYRTRTASSIRIRRGSALVEVNISSTFEETDAGVPVRLLFIQDMSQMKLRSEWIFKQASVELRTRQGSRTITKRLPMPEQPWLTPMAIHRYWDERCEAGADEITYRMIDPENGLDPVTVHSVLEGESQYAFAGRSIPVTRWRTTLSHLPGITSRELYSSDGYLMRSEIDLGFGRMVTRIATPAEVEAAEDAVAPELMLNTFVRTEKPIPRTARASTATFNVRALNGSPLTLPTAGAQRIGEASGDAATLLIDIHDPVAATEEELADESFTGSSTFADSEDALVQALARRAVRHSGDDQTRRAEAMRLFVYRYISGKDLDTAFATASETAKLRTGDCSEHAVLLCAMLRAEDIPARIATGLIYIESFLGERNVFGWHMWTQALIGGRWIDLDATLPRAYHAGHVLVSTSGMADGVASGELAALLSLLGNIEIEVVDVGYD